MKSLIYDSSDKYLKEFYFNWALPFENIKKLSLLSIYLLNSRYQNSKIGWYWDVIYFWLLSFGLINLFRQWANPESILIGLWVFYTISGAISEGISIFNRNKGWLLSERRPLGVYVYPSVINCIKIFIARGLFVIFPFLTYFGISLNLSIILMPVLLLMLAVNIIFVHVILGIITLRFPDLGHVISIVMRFAIFFTPIIWTPEGNFFREILSLINPITYFIDITREIILEGVIELKNLIFTCFITLLLFFISIVIDKRYSSRISTWM